MIDPTVLRSALRAEWQIHRTRGGQWCSSMCLTQHVSLWVNKSVLDSCYSNGNVCAGWIRPFVSFSLFSPRLGFAGQETLFSVFNFSVWRNNGSVTAVMFRWIKAKKKKKRVILGKHTKENKPILILQHCNYIHSEVNSVELLTAVSLHKHTESQFHNICEPVKSEKLITEVITFMLVQLLKV